MYLELYGRLFTPRHFSCLICGNSNGTGTGKLS